MIEVQSPSELNDSSRVACGIRVICTVGAERLRSFSAVHPLSPISQNNGIISKN